MRHNSSDSLESIAPVVNNTLVDEWMMQTSSENAENNARKLLEMRRKYGIKI